MQNEKIFKTRKYEILRNEYEKNKETSQIFKTKTLLKSGKKTKKQQK